MYARVSIYKGNEATAEQALELFQDDVLPWLREATGFRGVVILHDRDAERSLAITFWDTHETVVDPEKSGIALRDEVSAVVGSSLEAQEIYEVMLAEGIGSAPDAAD